jgi:hypothetical protein
MRLVQHGSVFTAGPAPANPYTLRLLTYWLAILIGAQKSGNGRDKARLSIPNSKGRGLSPLFGKQNFYVKTTPFTSGA